jgi:hypothetical protein
MLILHVLYSQQTVVRRTEGESDTQSVPEPELMVLSVIPHEQPPEWKPESSHMYKYLVTAHSRIIFLTHNYGIVYCLDMSPSLSAVVSAIYYIDKLVMDMSHCL